MDNWESHRLLSLTVRPQEEYLQNHGRAHKQGLTMLVKVTNKHKNGHKHTWKKKKPRTHHISIFALYIIGKSFLSVYLNVSTKIQLALLWKYILLQIHSKPKHGSIAGSVYRTFRVPAHAWTSSNDGRPHLPQLYAGGRSETWRKHSLQQFILQSSQFILQSSL